MVPATICQRRNTQIFDNVPRSSVSQFMSVNDIRLLEVGAVQPGNYRGCESWMDVTAIDLCSRHPSILEQDFLLMDLSERGEVRVVRSRFLRGRLPFDTLKVTGSRSTFCRVYLHPRPVDGMRSVEVACDETVNDTRSKADGGVHHWDNVTELAPKAE